MGHRAPVVAKGGRRPDMAGPDQSTAVAKHARPQGSHRPGHPVPAELLDRVRRGEQAWRRGRPGRGCRPHPGGHRQAGRDGGEDPAHPWPHRPCRRRRGLTRGAEHGRGNHPDRGPRRARPLPARRPGAPGPRVRHRRGAQRPARPLAGRGRHGRGRRPRVRRAALPRAHPRPHRPSQQGRPLRAGRRRAVPRLGRPHRLPLRRRRRRSSARSARSCSRSATRSRFLCGHGPGSTIALERRTNPYAGERAG